MPKIQVKNVPDQVHAVLRDRAAHVALAEALDCPLVTADARLAAAPGVRCEIVVLDV